MGIINESMADYMERVGRINEADKYDDGSMDKPASAQSVNKLKEKHSL